MGRVELDYVMNKIPILRKLRSEYKDRWSVEMNGSFTFDPLFGSFRGSSNISGGSIEKV